MLKKNKTLEKIKAGQTVFGIRMDFASPLVVESLGATGIDWVYLDCEHGPMNETECEHMIRAAEAVGITPIVRTPSGRPEVVSRFLDIGAMGIVIPHCDSREAGVAAVAAIKYPPQGERSIGGRCFSLSGMTTAQYMTEANRETMVIVMIEDPKAINNFSEIVKVNGIDVFLIGRNDLSISLGVPGQLEHPMVKEAVDKIIDQARLAGKAVGVGALDGNIGNPDSIRQFISQGVRFFPVSYITIANRAAKDLLEKIKCN
jgi:2-keto-3-deoxy-L-rhamnonate aldolase RhmA